MNLGLRTAQFIVSRAISKPLALPVNLTLSLLYTCNSRCKTCNVWKKTANNFTLEEYEKTFQKFGKNLHWITFSGGEPFLRRDIGDIAIAAYKHCKPKIFNFPTNGILTAFVLEQVEKIVKNCPETTVVVNLSIDGIGTEHDEIRGVKRNFEVAMKTWAGLKKIRENYPNIVLGIGTVISSFNVEKFQQIYDYVRNELKPDSHVTEVAEERIELDSIGYGITPSATKYAKAIEFLQDNIQNNGYEGFSKITQAFRLEYYNIAKKYLFTREQVIPCFAGIASAQISPDGHVWGCCIRAESLGNLRDHNYDFEEVWKSARAQEFRRSVKNKECACPLANASYTNMLCSPKTLLKVGGNFVKLNLK